MILIIGGAGQGKLDYALRTYGLSAADVARSFDAAREKAVFYGLHLAVAEALSRGEEPSAAMERVLADNPGVIVLCDEVGGGVVPMEPEQRAWREAVGRLCCALAARADRVVRVFCGLPMALKGE